MPYYFFVGYMEGAYPIGLILDPYLHALKSRTLNTHLNTQHGGLGPLLIYSSPTTPKLAAPVPNHKNVCHI
jgi:hypothetical protein